MTYAQRYQRAYKRRARRLPDAERPKSLQRATRAAASQRQRDRRKGLPDEQLPPSIRDAAKRAYQAKYRRKHAANPTVPSLTKERIREKWLLRQFGMTLAEYWRLSRAQRGRCAVCRKPPGKKALAVDHCHKTGRVRGLLCFLCNSTLGRMNDDPKLFMRAIAYLERA